MGGVRGGDDVRGDEHTNDVSAAAAASSTAIDLLDDDPDLCLTPPNTGVAGVSGGDVHCDERGDERTKDVGAAAAAHQPQLTTISTVMMAAALTVSEVIMMML